MSRGSARLFTDALGGGLCVCLGVWHRVAAPPSGSGKSRGVGGGGVGGGRAGGNPGLLVLAASRQSL